MAYRVITDGIDFKAQVQDYDREGYKYWKTLRACSTEQQANNCVKAERAKHGPPIKVCSYWTDIEGKFEPYL